MTGTQQRSRTRLAAPAVASALLALTALPALAAPFGTFQDCPTCPVMVELPLGSFTMGGPPGESRLNVHWGPPIRPVTPEDPYIAAHEGPLHRVEIDRPIAMGRDEVTYDQWMACVEDGGCGGHVPDSEILWLNPQDVVERITVQGSHPVIDVSYLDMQLYMDWLNEEVGAPVYRLPTEAEWEYAARAGTQTPFWTGDEIGTDRANTLGGATEIMLGEARPDLTPRGGTVPVEDLHAANPWGLRHIEGNVMEQTMSCWTERHAGWATASEYPDAATDTSCWRVLKGGRYTGAMDYGRPAQRVGNKESARSKISGFRVVREMR